MGQGSILKAALLGGILAGVVSSLPLLSLLCCVWVMGGGAFAAWTLISDSDGRASLGRCALGGFLAGAVAGAICSPLGALVGRMVQGEEAIEAQVEQLMEIMGSSGDMLSPADVESLARGAAYLEFNGWTIAAMLVASLMFSFFGLLGGLLGGSLLGRGRRAAAAGKASAFPAMPPANPSAVPESRGELPPDELPELPPREDEPEP